MTRLIEFLISLAIVAALFLVVGILLPSSRSLSESAETNRKMTIVYDTISSFNRFSDWHPLVLRDPDAEIEISGPESGVGARLEYSSDASGIGEGSWEIVAAEPNKSVTYELTSPEPGTNKRTTFTLQPTGRSGRNVEITQTYNVDYGWNLIGRYAGLYVSSNIGQDMRIGLSRLSNMLATVPNYDYAQLAKDNPEMVPRVERRPAENLLVVTAAVERNNAVVQRQMQSNMEWIRKVMAANDLEAAGPMRIITNEFGEETYSFDTAVPVRKSGSAGGSEDEAGDEAADETAAEGDAAEAAPAPVAQVADATQLEVDVEGPVQAVFSPAAQTAVLPYTGPMASLAPVRDALRAWALTRGYDTAERPYEKWENGIETGFTTEGEFEVIWAIK